MDEFEKYYRSFSDEEWEDVEVGDAFRAGLATAGARIASLEAKLAQALEALRSCESPHFCPSCDAKLGPETHKSDCLLWAVWTSADTVEGRGG